MDKNDKYIELVLCRGKDSGRKYLAKAPAFEHLITASRITISSASEDCIVIAEEDVRVGSPEYAFALALFGAGDELPLVVSRLTERLMEWEVENDV